MSFVRCTACNKGFLSPEKSPLFCQYCGGRMTTKETLVVEDTFRKKHGGFQGEVAMYRVANEQHKKTHKIVTIDCKICMAITRGMARLIDEGREMETKKK